MPKLKKKEHELFCQYYVAGDQNASEAYAKAYGRENDAANRACASRLLTNANVKVRIAELLERAQKSTDVTLLRITEMLLKTHKDAEAAKDVSNARQCAMDLAKLHGLIVDKSKVESENVQWVMSDETMDAEDWEKEFGDPDSVEAAAGASNGPH